MAQSPSVPRRCNIMQHSSTPGQNDSSIPATELVQRARALRSPDEAVAHYRNWAQTYDRDVFEVLGVTGSARIADLLAHHHGNRTSPVLDLGCGTGAVGRQLNTHGFLDVDGWDISAEMIAFAERTGSYRRFQVVDLTKPLPLVPPNDQYSACVSAGTFTSGHIDASSVERINAALAETATLAWVIGEAMADSFRSVLTRLGFVIVFDALEPIRAGGPSESVMLVARR